MFNSLICLFFVSLTQTQELIQITELNKKNNNRLAKFDPTHLYTEAQAVRIIKAGNDSGNQLLAQAEKVQDSEEKLQLIHKANTYFDYGVRGILCTTNIFNSPQALLLNSTSAYLKAYTAYQKLMLMPLPTIMEANELRKLYNATQYMCISEPAYFDSNQQESVNAMLVESFRKTGSPLLLSTLLETPLLYNPDIISSLWDGMQTWSPECFAQNMQILSEHSCDFLQNTTILTDPLIKLLFYNTCLNKEFNPFTLEQDRSTFEVLKYPMLNALNAYMHNTILDEQSRTLLKDILFSFEKHSIQHTLDKGTPQHIIDMLQGYFTNKVKITNIYKNYRLITPLLRQHLLMLPQYARLMTTLCQMEDNPAIDTLRAYVDLNSQLKRQTVGLSHLKRSPSVVGLLSALEQTKIHKNWKNLTDIIPAFISHIQNLDYDNLIAHTDFFSQWCMDEELLNHIDPALVNMVAAHYYSFLVHTALHENKEVPPLKLVDYHLLSREYANEWLATPAGQKQLVQSQESGDIFLQNGIILGILAQSSKILTIQGKQIVRLIAQDPSASKKWHEVLQTSFHFLKENKKEQLLNYFENSDSCTNDAYASLINVLAFLYYLEQQLKNDSTTISVLQVFLDELASMPADKLDNLSTDDIYELTQTTYHKNGNKELLCVIRDHAPEIEDLALVVANYLGKIKNETQENKVVALNFLEDTDILATLRAFPDNPTATLVLADAQAGHCTSHALFDQDDYRTSQSQHLEVLENLIKKLKTFTFEESEVVTKKLNDIEDIYCKEKLLWDMEFDYEAALATVKEMVASNNNDQFKLSRLRYAINFRKNKDNNGFDAFFKFCITKSLEAKQYKHASALISTFAEKSSPCFEACLELLQKEFSPILAKGILYNLPATDTRLANTLCALIESRIPEWRSTFITMDEGTQLNLLELLEDVSQKLISPISQLALFELRKIKDSNNNNDANNVFELVDMPDDSLRRVVKQLQQQLPSVLTETPSNYAETFKFVHGVLDKYVACNFFQEAKKHLPKDETALYNLLYAQTLWVASQAHYAKLLPKGSEYESLKHQLKTARTYMEIIKRLNKEKFIGQENQYESLIKNMEGLELSLDFQHNPQECIQYLATHLDKIFNEYDLLEKKDDLMRKITFCFPYGSLHDCVRYLEKNAQTSNEQMLLSYLSYVIAKKTNDLNMQKEYIKKIIKVGTCSQFNQHAAQILMGIYEGTMFPEFKDDNKANEVQNLIEKNLLEKYSKLYKTAQWGTAYPRLKFAAQSGFTNAALVLSQIYKLNNELDDANIFAEQALKNELYFKNNQPGTYNRLLHARAERLLAEINYKMMKSKRH